jgi:hypothetical protein
MKNILLISYHGPPKENIGAIRINKFLKYLPNFGYQPYILSGGNEYYDSPFVFRPKYLDPYIILKYLYKIITSNNNNYFITKYNLNQNKPKGLFPLSESRMPDKFLFWILPAVILGKRLISKISFELIYSSSGPPSSAIVASFLQKHSGLPWIAEFRDLWSDNPYDLRKPLIHKIDSKIEIKTLHNCSAIVTVSEPLKEILARKYNKNIYIIHNGYDEDDYPNEINLTEKFTITYTGKIYPGKRDPSALFNAVAEMHKENIIQPNIFEIRFYGKELDQINYLKTKYNVDNYVNINGYLTYKESLKKQKESWLLLLLEWNDPLAKGTLTGKLFEYIGARRPILCICYENSSIKTVLSKTGSGIILNSKEHIKEFLTKCLRKYYEKDESLGFQINKMEIEKYSRKKASQELSRIFSELIKK